MEGCQENSKKKHQTTRTPHQLNRNPQDSWSPVNRQTLRMLRGWKKSLFGHWVRVFSKKVYATEVSSSKDWRRTVIFHRVMHERFSVKWWRESAIATIRISPIGTSSQKISCSSTRTATTSSWSISGFPTNGKSQWKSRSTKRNKKNLSEQ